MPAFVPGTRPLRAVIYCRVSSDPSGQLLSVESQESFCRTFAEQRNIEILRVFVDNDLGASPHSLTERPDFQRMITWLQTADVDMLIAWASTRTTRTTREYLDLRDLCAERGILYSYNGNTYDMRNASDRFVTVLDAALAERGADEIRANVLRGKETAAMKGRPAGRLLWGTVREYDTHRVYRGTKTDPEIGRYLRYIFDARWYRRVPKYRLAKVLNRARVRTPQPPRLDYLPKDMPKAEKRRLRLEAWPSAQWVPEMITKILENPAYAGYQVHQGEIIGDSDWPGIITKERFHALQLRDAPDPSAPVKPRERRLVHLLTGIMECFLCPGVMRRTTRRDRKPSLSCKRCYGTTILLDIAEDAVVDLLMRRFALPNALDLFRPPADNTARAAAAAEYDRLTARLKAIETMAIGGDIDDLQFAGRARAELKPKIAAAKAAATPPAPLPDFVTALAVANPWPVWNRMPIETKRMTVRMLLRVVLKPDPRPGPVVTPVEERLDITWRPLP